MSARFLESQFSPDLLEVEGRRATEKLLYQHSSLYVMKNHKVTFLVAVILNISGVTMNKS